MEAADVALKAGQFMSFVRKPAVGNFTMMSFFEKASKLRRKMA